MKKENSLKKFIKEHKKALIVGGVIAAGVAGAIIAKQHKELSVFVDFFNKHDFVFWDKKSNLKHISLEEVTKLLKRNNNNNVMFAVIKDTLESDKYRFVPFESVNFKPVNFDILT